MLKRLATALIAVLALAAALVPAGAQARDRNRDRIPDRWEKRHHLSLHHDQARRDQDRDGLRNLAEFRRHTDPRDDDSDDDGVEDGDEHAGTVASYSGRTLTIAVAGGGTVSGTVDGSTEISCGGAGDDDHGDDEHGEDRRALMGEDEGDDDGSSGCTDAALTTGAVVEEAELAVAGGKATWREVRLLG